MLESNDEEDVVDEEFVSFLEITAKHRMERHNNTTQSPKLKPYPSWSAHSYEPRELVSPFRIRADQCGRLWVIDSGFNNLLSEEDRVAIRNPSLVVYDLHNDNLLRRYEFPSDQVKNDSLFANIAVEDDDCENTFAYVTDIFNPALLVYSWKQQSSWRVHHHYFHPDPLAGNYSIGNISFHWDDGLFGIALSKPQSDGYPTLYFHPLSSTNEFSVSTKFLRNETAATNQQEIFNEFKTLGTRGPNGQSAVSFLDKITGVLFYTLPNLNAIACWRTNSKTKTYTIKSQGRVFMSPVDMSFPNDIKVDDQDRLWVLSNKLHIFMYSELNPNDVNFRILTATVKDAIEHTACDTKTKPLTEIIDRLGGILRPSTAMPPVQGAANTSFNLSIISTIMTILISLIK
uniref:CSON010085 protein n=1 Tax=Culicoides sonorensis TaxID=179676 RepID=A0A336N1Q4_CULSO